MVAHRTCFCARGRRELTTGSHDEKSERESWRDLPAADWGPGEGSALAATFLARLGGVGRRRSWKQLRRKLGPATACRYQGLLVWSREPVITL